MDAASRVGLPMLSDVVYDAQLLNLSGQPSVRPGGAGLLPLITLRVMIIRISGGSRLVQQVRVPQEWG